MNKLDRDVLQSPRIKEDAEKEAELNALYALYSHETIDAALARATFHKAINRIQDKAKQRALLYKIFDMNPTDNIVQRFIIKIAF